MPYFVLADSNKNVFESIADLYNVTTFTNSHLFILWIHNFLRISHDSHNALYVTQCGIFLDYPIVESMRLFALSTKIGLYEVLTVLYFSADLLDPLESLS